MIRAAAAGVGAAISAVQICKPKKGECEFYRAWCEWGNKKGHRPEEDPEKYWTKDAPCGECYKECKETGKWPFEKCQMGGPNGPRWDDGKKFTPVWPD